ncbi:MAG: chemotaxis protein CheC [Candidatus Omnitrophica bacterium]|nr:chemotaxis protein CheC [Candidatus Omnitrophota bacterium]
MIELNDVQIDALREMGNIGAGNAATALSQLIFETINISVPSVKVTPLDEVAYLMGGPEKQVYVVYLEVMRTMEGTMLSLFSAESARFLTKKMLNKDDVDMQDELSCSALKEAGSILCGSYLSALSQIVAINSVASVPAMTFDMMGAMLDFILAEIGLVADDVILINVDLSIASTKLETSQLFIPKPRTLDLILASLGMG